MIPRGTSLRLGSIFLVALAVRLLSTLVLDWSAAWQITGRGAITPDEATTDLAARILVEGDERSPVVLGGSLHTAWLLLSWAVYDLVWNDLLAMKLVSSIFGAALTLPVYLMARVAHSEHAARWAAWAVALFPPAIVWSALALRETLIALLITTTVLLGLRTSSSTRGWVVWVLTGTMCLTLLWFTRSYMAPLLMGILIVGSALRRPIKRGAEGFVAATATALLCVVVVCAVPTGFQLLTTTAALVTDPSGSIYNPFSDCSQSSDCAPVADARSAGSEAAGYPQAEQNIPRSRDTSSPEEGAEADLDSSLQSVSRKGFLRALAIAVLAGRPVWRTEEFFFLLQPGVALWWGALPMMALGATALAKERKVAALLVTVGLMGSVVILLAFTGQFIRHHFMLEPVGLVLAAIGLAVLRGRSAWKPSQRTHFVVLICVAIMSVLALASIAFSLVRGPEATMLGPAPASSFASSKE